MDSNATNSTLTTAPQFVRTSVRQRWILVTFLGLITITSCCGNSLVLYLVKPRKGITTTFQGRITTKYFVRSPALSDLMPGLVGIPLLLAELTTDFLEKNTICHVHRYFQIVLIYITITNISVLGVERYLGIYFPLARPSRKTVLRAVLMAWLVGAISAAIHPGYTGTMKSYTIDADHYTQLCLIDDDPLSVKLNLGISIMVFFIPGIVLIAMSIRILTYLSRKRRQTSPQQPLPTSVVRGVSIGDGRNA
ncbi:neuromedin-U receptor 1 [Nematostella vectensis]|uniref:neuromedin-U receptor 1 n=1 Tax=Nematostella vectensis TaxID=45351 RepID=UPI0013904B24|nr:neuromedin-U receptor 1 [Nematostella vectensis]